MIVKSLVGKIKNKFNVTIIEAEEQDTHQIIVISIASFAANSGQADSIREHIIHFIEQNTEAEILEEKWEIR